MKVYTVVVGTYHSVPFSSDGQYVDCWEKEWVELTSRRKSFTTRAKAEAYAAAEKDRWTTTSIHEEEID